MDYPKTDYSLALVTSQLATCHTCGDSLDIRGLTVVEQCSSIRYLHHFYCYAPPPSLRITLSHLRHIDRSVPAIKVQAFLRRLDYLVSRNWKGDVSRYWPRTRSMKLKTPLVEAFKYLEVVELGKVVPVVCMEWYEQSIRDELWSDCLERFWPKRSLCTRQTPEPLKVFFLRILKTHCSDCLTEISEDSLGLKYPSSPQPLCISCAQAPGRALLSFHFLNKHYHCSYAGLRQAGVKPVLAINGTSFAFASQAYQAINSLRCQRKQELLSYLRQIQAAETRIQQVESLSTSTDFPLYRDLFEKRAQGYIYSKAKRAAQPLNDYLASFVLRQFPYRLRHRRVTTVSREREVDGSG